MSDETMEQFVQRRKSVLMNQITALRQEIEDKEIELTVILSVKAIVGKDPSGHPDLSVSNIVTGLKTIRQLIVKTLQMHPDGLLASDIRAFIKDAYGRDIDDATLRSQLHRCKGHDLVQHELYGGLWTLVRD